MNSKKCVKCNQSYPNTLEYFYPQSNRDGTKKTRNKCKTCQNQEDRLRRNKIVPSAENKIKVDPPPKSNPTKKESTKIESEDTQIIRDKELQFVKKLLEQEEVLFSLLENHDNLIGLLYHNEFTVSSQAISSKLKDYINYNKSSRVPKTYNLDSNVIAAIKEMSNKEDIKESDLVNAIIIKYFTDNY